MTSDTSLASALAAGTVVLDGGMSNQLESAGHDLSDELWSARLLAERPEAITEAHLAYFEAGADVAITASYQATFEGFAKRGIGRERAAELLALSVESAREAARRAAAKGVARPLWVAASVGPYGAMLADGSEYRGRYGLSVDELADFHRPRLEVLAAARPDVLALETVPDADEARALLRVVRGLGVPAWLSYTVDGEHTRAGQPLEEAFALAADVDEVVAVGVNCCAPQDVDGAVRIAARVTGKPVVVYPNSGEAWDAGARAWAGRSSFTPEEVTGWRASGARLIGGCCRVGPEAITGIAAAPTP
ncbi:homocysteine S-methyltransferase [Streptomyces sp. NPDC094149]|uniref:homocysteine S-methyltransferase n=1 Tax=Streptomyces sp. NPDC094149 TaxID=3155079 RepID=UPI00331AD488